MHVPLKVYIVVFGMFDILYTWDYGIIWYLSFCNSFLPMLFYNFYLDTGFHFVTQARAQWHAHSSLQPVTRWLKRSSSRAARTTGSCYYVRIICLDNFSFIYFLFFSFGFFFFFFFFWRERVLLCYLAWSQTPGLKPSSCLGFPKSWNYRHEPPLLTPNIFLNVCPCWCGRILCIQF